MEQNRKLAKNAFWAKDGQGNEAYLYANGEITSGVKYEKAILNFSISTKTPEQLLELDLCNIFIKDDTNVLYFIDIYGNALNVGGNEQIPCRPYLENFYIVVNASILAANEIDITQIMYAIEDKPLAYQIHVNNQLFLVSSDNLAITDTRYNLPQTKTAFLEVKTATQTIIKFNNITINENDIITISYVNSYNYCNN